MRVPLSHDARAPSIGATQGVRNVTSRTGEGHITRSHKQRDGIFIYKQARGTAPPPASIITSHSITVVDQIYPSVVMDARDSLQVVAAPGLIPDDRTAPAQTKRALEPLLGGDAVEVAERTKLMILLDLGRRTFLVCLAVLCLVVGATVGGSVGGALAVQQSR